MLDDTLAPADRRVADQLLELGPDEVSASAVTLGQRLGTSDATIVRTAKALGFASLAELRRAVVAERQRRPRRPPSTNAQPCRPQRRTRKLRDPTNRGPNTRRQCRA